MEASSLENVSSPGTAARGEKPGTPLRILLVEDSKSDAKLVAFALRAMNRPIELQRVDDAASLREALETAAWDVVLSDWNMPSFTALEALEIVQATGLDFPFILVSGTIGEDVAVEAIRAGVSDYVLKDRLVRLVPTIERELGDREERIARGLAEQALHTSAAAARNLEARFRALVEKSTDGITLITPQSTYLYISPAAARIFGRSAATMLETTAREYIAPDDVERARQDHREIVAEPGASTVAERCIVAPDGTRRWLEVTATNMLDDPAVCAIVHNIRDITERKQLDELLHAALRQKELLLREIHHRVKNNLQVVSSLLSLQASRIEDPRLRAVFLDSQARVRSIGLLHERLCESHDLGEIDMDSYVRQLTSELLFAGGALEGEVTVHASAPAIALGIDAAVPCGLIVNELVTNSLKHAFKGKTAGAAIQVAMTREGEAIVLVVADNGAGCAISPEVARQTLGLQLVASLVCQLEGTLAFDGAHGMRSVVTFPAGSRA